MYPTLEGLGWCEQTEPCLLTAACGICTTLAAPNVGVQLPVSNTLTVFAVPLCACQAFKGLTSSSATTLTLCQGPGGVVQAHGARQVGAPCCTHT